MPDEVREINSQVNFQVKGTPLNDIVISISIGSEAYFSWRLPRQDALELFKRISKALGHHDLDQYTERMAPGT